MSTLTLTTTKEVEPSEVADLFTSLYSSHSPWFPEHSVDLEKQTVTLSYWDQNAVEGERVLRKRFGFDQVLSALQKARETAPHALCCWDDMTKDELGYGCSQDADVVAQYLVFDGLVYG